MRRTQIYLDEQDAERLAKRAARAGVTRSALIRDAIARYLEHPEDDAERLEQFRAAVGEAAGIAPYLPSGAEYVDRFRVLDRRHEDEIERLSRG